MKNFKKEMFVHHVNVKKMTKENIWEFSQSNINIISLKYPVSGILV